MYTNSIALKDFKRTKIIAGIGPATNSYEMIEGLIAAGANGMRFNFSHGSYDERVQQIKWIRSASAKLNKPVAIIQDLQGPKIRLGEIEGTIQLTKGQEISFGYNTDYVTTGHLPCQYDLSTRVKPGERILLYDGKVGTIVEEVKDGIVYATVQNNGVIMKRKGMNLPDTDFEGDTITEKDKQDLEFGFGLDIDYVAQSFIQSAADVINMRKLMNAGSSKSKLIAKIESAAAVENLEEIIDNVDMVMVARGDLAVETSPESVPIVQRRIIELCHEKVKPVIVATQMLLSMMDNPEQMP
jgi:pyruvate kinase